MTEETTPLNNEVIPTPENVTETETADNAGTPDNTAPEAANNGTADNAVEAVKSETTATDNNTEQPKLYAGKYKSVDELEKGYKEAQKFVSRANELEKQLKAYRDMEESAREQREITARQQGYADAGEQQLRYDVANHELSRYAEALETTLSGDAYTKAKDALIKYQQTGNVRFLENARGYFAPSVIAEIAKDTALYEETAGKRYQEERYTAQMTAAKKRLEEFTAATGDWLNAPARQNILGMAYNLTGGNLDYDKVKALIDDVEKSAVETYIARQKESSENSDIRNSLTTPGTGAAPQNGEHWLTKEEYFNLSPAQEEKLMPKIRQQIELENEGKLPRRLT